jgi:muramidase (phage lysozyme)
MFPIARRLLLVLFSVMPKLVMAQSASLFSPATEGVQAVPLIAMRVTTDGLQPQATSLFSGNVRHSFLSPLPDRPVEHGKIRIAPVSGGTAAIRIRNLIAEAEAGAAGYDAVNGGARIKPPKAPSQMTVQEIYDWIDATPGQPHAIGRYQFIPATLRRLIDQVDANPNARFSPELQDRLGDELLVEGGLLAFERGDITRRSFMYRLAKIWAGLPLPSGESYYEGYAGNKATMTWTRFDTAMADIFSG